MNKDTAVNVRVSCTAITSALEPALETRHSLSDAYAIKLCSRRPLKSAVASVVHSSCLEEETDRSDSFKCDEASFVRQRRTWQSTHCMHPLNLEEHGATPAWAKRKHTCDLSLG